MTTELPPFDQIWQPIEIHSAWQEMIDAQNEVRQWIKEWEVE
jgi:hypothetical protein